MLMAVWVRFVPLNENASHEVKIMRVAVFGGTGFVGSYLVDALVAAGHHPVLLVREGNEDRVTQPDSCTIVNGDIKDGDAIQSTLDGTDAVIYNIGLLREFPDKGISFQYMHLDAVKYTIEAAQEAGVKRYLLMSANGVKPGGTRYQTTKFEAEQYLMSSGLGWTIFRPSVIFGDPRGRMEFATQLRQDIIDSPMPAPLFFKGLLPVNAGKFQLSPVHVTNVADAFMKSLDSHPSIGKIYTLGGPQDLTWQEILNTIEKAVGKKKLMLPVPACAVSAVARIFEGFEVFPITHEQIDMLIEGNTCSADDLYELGITPVEYNSENLQYLNG
jgi:NADH dehydrogenase